MFNARDIFNVNQQQIGIYRLSRLQDQGLGQIDRLPYSIRILLESVLRNYDGHSVTAEDVKHLAAYDPANPAKVEIQFKPARVVLQEFTGVSAIVDLAEMRGER